MNKLVKLLLLSAIMLITKVTISQSLISIEGKLHGLSKDSVVVRDLANKIILKGYMSGGEFILGPTKIEPGIFTLNIGRYKTSVFLNHGQVSVSGYLDPSSFEGEDITISGSNLNDRFNSIVQNIELEKRTYSREVAKNLKKDLNKEDHNHWVEKYDLKENYLTKFVEGIVQKETSPELAAYIAYKYRGPFYENAKILYDVLSRKSRKSLSGKLLANDLDRMLAFANGQEAPGFCVKNEQDEDVYLKDLKGKILVVDFWASWCGPCRNELQYLKETYKIYNKKGVEFISISLDDTREKWSKAFEDEKIPWINLWDSDGFKKSKLKDLYRFSQIPFIVVIDKNGKIAGKKLRRGRLEEKLKELTK